MAISIPFLWRAAFLFSFIKSKRELWKIFKILSGSFTIFALSNHTTFSQTQTGATVPLITASRYQVPCNFCHNQPVFCVFSAAANLVTEISATGYQITYVISVAVNLILKFLLNVIRFKYVTSAQPIWFWYLCWNYQIKCDHCCSQSFFWNICSKLSEYVLSLLQLISFCKLCCKLSCSV